MSDRSPEPPADDSSDSADGDFEPGGGPQRVASEESVDDILDSLNDSKPDSSGPAATITTETDATLESEPDDARANPDPKRDPGGEGGVSGDDPVPEETTAEGESTGVSSDTAPGDESNNSTAPDGSNASSLPDDASEESLEELAARVEQGTVTGADVRAAEAGDGRDETPGIDEIDLSVDDLERPDATIGSGASSDAGPLAGSIDPSDATDEGAGDGDNKASTEDGSGLLGRLVGLFSR